MGWTKRHSYFYPDGPDTFETILPVPAAEVPPLLRDWPGLKRKCDLYPDRLMKGWVQRAESLQGQFSRTLRNWIGTCVPYSIVQFEEWTWIAFKRKGMVEQTTCHGNCILMPLNRPLDIPPHWFPLDKNPEIEEFVQVFRNVCGSIPPTNTLWSEDKPPELLKEKPNHPLGKWQNALPILHEGNGDVIVVRRDGKLGRFWKGGAYSPLPELMKPAQFLQVLDSLFGGEFIG